MSISDAHHLHSCHDALFVSLLIPQRLSHLSYFTSYCVIYESVLTAWPPFIILLLDTRHTAAFVDCLPLILQEGWESGFSQSNLESQRPPYSLRPVRAQFCSNRADVMMIANDLAQRQHLLPEQYP